MEQKKKKINIKILVLIAIVVLAIIGIVAVIKQDPTKKMTKDQMLQVAESKTLSYFQELTDNTALAETQKNKIFKIYGKIYNIENNHVEIAEKCTMLKIYLPKEELAKLKKDQYISVVGSLNNISTKNILGLKTMFFDFKNCYLLDQEKGTSGSYSEGIDTIQKEYREVKNIVGF